MPIGGDGKRLTHAFAGSEVHQDHRVGSLLRSCRSWFRHISSSGSDLTAVLVIRIRRQSHVTRLPATATPAAHRGRYANTADAGCDDPARLFQAVIGIG